MSSIWKKNVIALWSCPSAGILAACSVLNHLAQATVKKSYVYETEPETKLYQYIQAATRYHWKPDWWFDENDKYGTWSSLQKIDSFARLLDLYLNFCDANGMIQKAKSMQM